MSENRGRGGSGNRGRRRTTRGSPNIASESPNQSPQHRPVQNGARQIQNETRSIQNEPRPILERFVDGAEDPVNHAIEESLNTRPLFEDDSTVEEDDPETLELSRLRCSSVQTEVITERSRRNGQPSAGYPGLAFGTSVFGSNTMMKYRIISNELHNIMNVYLRRAEGEMTALSNRITVLEGDLDRSAESLKDASISLEEAAKAVSENEVIGEEIQTRTSMEDNRIALLDHQLNKARLAAEETDKNYKMMAREIAVQQSGCGILPIAFKSLQNVSEA